MISKQSGRDELIVDNIPLRLNKNKSTFQSMNLNQFRNNHHHLNNKMKRQFDGIFRNLCGAIDDECPQPPLELTYTIFRKDKRRSDLGNICSIIDKFVSDSLVHCGFISDDNTDIIKSIRFIDGGIDKDNPRCRLEIKSYYPETEKGEMKHR